MSVIIFKSDFRGRETGEVFYQAGQTAPFSDDIADRLVHDGRADYMSSGSTDQPAKEAENVKKSGAKGNNRRKR